MTILSQLLLYKTMIERHYRIQIKLKLLVLVLLLVSSSKLLSEETNKYDQAGLAVQIGNGIIYGGVGGLAEYQIFLKENLRITPLAGLGFSVGGSDTSNIEYHWLNCAIGLNLEWGKKHRIIFGPQIISGYNIFNKPSDASINKKMYVGSSFIVGYKGTASFGLIWQIYFGGSYLQNPLDNENKYLFEPHIGLGTGYKF